MTVHPIRRTEARCHCPICGSTVILLGHIDDIPDGTSWTCRPCRDGDITLPVDGERTERRVYDNTQTQIPY